MLVATAPVDESVAQVPAPTPKRPSKAVLLETLLVVVSPVVLFFVLRLRAMAPGVGPDPAMHTVYIIDPHDFLARFASQLTASSGTREGARVGFLVPARLSYLAFGAVRGFFVFRYLLALVAIVPSYVLLRRLYSRAAGVMAIVILMSSPVLITAWGTDYPDSAIVSYLTGGLACLAMPGREQRRPVWLAVAAGLFTMAVWANIAAAPLVAATMLVYLAICWLRNRRRIRADALVLFATAVFVTGALMLASGLLLGPFDYIVPTLKAYEFLNRASIVRDFHSTNPRWILLRPYLLVPVAVVAVWGATVLRRLRAVPAPQLLIGMACMAQIAVFGYLQFFGDAEVLQQRYYSSSLWASICLLLAVTVCALAQPLLNHRLARWLPAVLVLAIPLVYEIDPHPPALGWLPTGLLIVAVMILAAGIGRLVSNARPPTARATVAAVIVVIMGCSLILTVAPYERHAPLPGVINNTVPAYVTALGGSSGNLIDQYRVATELPRFVGNSTYPGERLLMWFPWPQRHQLMEIIGIYHGELNSLPNGPPGLTAADTQLLQSRQPAEILVFNTPNLAATLRALAPFAPSLLRAKMLTSGHVAVRAWLISLGVYMHREPT